LDVLKATKAAKPERIPVVAGQSQAPDAVVVRV
jgi:hypothetical protein